MNKYVISLLNETATLALGATIAFACHQACIIYLYGNLGGGKTTFCRGFLRALGHFGIVKSPTYTLVELYILPLWKVYHFDLYRLSDPQEFELTGMLDYFDNSALYLVEWPQRGKNILPEADIELTLDYLDDYRQAQIKGLSTLGKDILTYLAPLKELPE